MLAVLHGTRHLFIRQQTAVTNTIRAHLPEFGIIAQVGPCGVEALLGVIANLTIAKALGLTIPEVLQSLSPTR